MGKLNVQIGVWKYKSIIQYQNIHVISSNQFQAVQEKLHVKNVL